jgi:hypothetical protein
MKVKFSSAVTMFVVAALLVSALGVFKPAYAAPTEIYMVPSANDYTTNTGSIGTLFDVTVYAKDIAAPGAAAWQVYLEFNDDIINVTKWVEPTADAAYLFNGKTTSANPTPPDPGYVHLIPGKGRIQVAANLFPTPPTQQPTFGAGPFKLCVLTFNITQLPAKLGSLSCVLAINKASTTLLDSDGNDIVPITKTDGSYSITWAPPAAPGLGFDKADYAFDNSHHWIGTTFPVKVYIKGLSAAWFISGASFNVNWDDLTLIDCPGGVADVTIDPLWAISFVTYVPGQIGITVGLPTSNPSGDVLVATITFTILKQGTTPPQTLPDIAHLTFCPPTFFENDVGPIPVGLLGSATVTVQPFLELHQPYLEVRPHHTYMGPNPVIGEEFSVDVFLTGTAPWLLEENWRTVGAQFRLFFDNTLIEPVAIEAGPFFQDPAWNLYGVFFYGTYELDGLGPHVLVGELILPNGVGVYDQTEYPNGEGSICTITFKVLRQECPDPFVSPLTLDSVFGEFLIDNNGEYIPAADPISGDVTILPFDTPGRVIDLFGGAVNDGYGVLVGSPYLQFMPPYGGQGPNHWMDLVFPQSWVYLHAYLTYNYWPVQSKQVGFEIEGPYEKDEQGNLVPKQRYQIWAKLTATTDQDGYASISYRMPWPCEDPDGITGIWKITATAAVADVVIMDTMIFYYERACYITSVTTDKYYYIHEEIVKVTVECRTHSVQYYPKLMSVVIMDDLGVPFGMALISSELGGATFCTWEYQEHTVEIFIPKWAYAGYAHIHVNCFDKDPTDGGFAYCPEFAPAPEIQIGPY